MLFFIEHCSWHVHLAGCAANLNGAWVAQQTRQLAWTLSKRSTLPRFLIRDGDSKVTRVWDA